MMDASMAVRWAAGILALLATSGPISAQDLQAASAYRLGAQDKLRIKVYDWRRETGEAHEWTALTGEFTVGAAGTVFLPLVGEVAAGRQTTSDVAREIASQLQKRFGLAAQPDASVEVVEYRPFYVVGIVDKAGAYPYRPGLTVLQAVGVAGGVSRLREASLLGYERDVVATRGELRVLSSQRLTLLAREARFAAEIEDAAAVVFPSELLALKADPMVARMMNEEELLFRNARESLAKQVDSLDRTTDLLQHEVAALAAKDVSLAHQMDLAKKELDTVSALVTKGLTIVPRQLAVEQNVSQFESGRLDLQLASLRAKQEMARVEREIVTLRETRRATALSESREIGAKLTATEEQIETAQNLIYQSQVRAPQVVAADREEDRASFVYRVTRDVDGTPTTQDVAEGDHLQPGDTLTVDQRRDRDLVSDRR